MAIADAATGSAHHQPKELDAAVPARVTAARTAPTAER
jgi:hypothetical protein